MSEALKNNIPISWNKTNFGDLGTFQNGLNKSKRDFGFGTRFVNILDVYSDKLNVDELGRMNANQSELAAYRLEIGDILIDRSSVKLEGVGYPTIFEGADEPIIFCGFIIRFRISNSDVNPFFLCKLMRNDLFRNRIFKIATRSANVNVNQEQLAKLDVLIPPLPEQQKIAEILDTVEKAIALTQTHINKLKQAKAGLLHDLLTKGIDEHGELRNPKRNPEQFKDSPFGKIPKDWEITTLGNMLERSGGFIQTGPFGSQLHAHEYVNSGVPVIMPQDIINGLISTKQIEYISSKKARSLKRHIVQINDIIFARRGDLNRCTAIGERESNWFCGTGCMLARIPKHEINGYWLAEIYRHRYSQKQIQAKAVGSTMVNLNSTLLNSLIIAKPSIKEQKVICKEIAIQQEQIISKQTRLEKLKLLKKGLMSDLLTGKVRVKI